MKRAILVATVGAMPFGVNAGDWGKAPVGKAPIEECGDLRGEISVGYMTDYIYNGFRAPGFLEDSVWADVNYTFDGLAVPINVGVWYLNALRTDFFGTTSFDQLDLYASADLGTVAGFDASIGYTHHSYPELRSVPNSFQNNSEVGLNLRRSLGFVDLVAETNYMFNFLGSSAHGWYHQAGLEKSFGLTDSISLILSGGAGYLDLASPDVLAFHGFSNYYLSAALPIRLNCRTTLTPYVGYHEMLNGQTNVDAGKVHSGVTLSVTLGDVPGAVGKSPIEGCSDLGGEISVGYATDYYLNGYQMGEDTIWTDLNYTFDGLAVPVTVGATYMNSSVFVGIDQLDVYANIALGTFLGFETTAGYTHHYFPELNSFIDVNFGQANLGLRRSLGFADLLMGTNYLVEGGPDANVDAWYHTIGLEKSISLTDEVSLVVSGGAGYLDGQMDYAGLYGQQGHGWSNYHAKIALPIQLNCRTTLTPYVGYYKTDGAHTLGDNFVLPPDVTPANNVHSGVSLSVTF